jgi:uncharacterized protein YggE
MSKQAVSDQIADSLDQTAHLTALHSLLVILVKTHPAKAEVLEAYRDMMTHLSERMRDKARPDVAQADPTLVQDAEGSAEVLAQLAGGYAQFAKKLQEYAQRLLEDCQ